ncbi:putative ubiquitinyl hydrolase 1 [Helianthus annuus]|nr:putative ubiquitinyl hydrolase 1 [Helianthus annuus]
MLVNTNIGHPMKLVIHPNGNKSKKAGEFLSVYLTITDTASLTPGWEVYATFRIFLLNQNNDNYLKVEDERTNGRRFYRLRTEWGFDQFISIKELGDSNNGYLLGDNCVFGAEVFVRKERSKGKIELLSLVKDAVSYKRTRKINNYSKVDADCENFNMFNGGFTKIEPQDEEAHPTQLNPNVMIADSAATSHVKPIGNHEDNDIIPKIALKATSDKFVLASDTIISDDSAGDPQFQEKGASKSIPGVQIPDTHFDTTTISGDADDSIELDDAKKYKELMVELKAEVSTLKEVVTDIPKSQDQLKAEVSTLNSHLTGVTPPAPRFPDYAQQAIDVKMGEKDKEDKMNFMDKATIDKKERDDKARKDATVEKQKNIDLKALEPTQKKEAIKKNAKTYGAAIVKQNTEADRAAGKEVRTDRKISEKVKMDQRHHSVIKKAGELEKKTDVEDAKGVATDAKSAPLPVQTNVAHTTTKTTPPAKKAPPTSKTTSIPSKLTPAPSTKSASTHTIGMKRQSPETAKVSQTPQKQEKTKSVVHKSHTPGKTKTSRKTSTKERKKVVKEPSAPTDSSQKSATRKPTSTTSQKTPFTKKSDSSSFFKN